MMAALERDQSQRCSSPPDVSAAMVPFAPSLSSDSPLSMVRFGEELTEEDSEDKSIPLSQPCQPRNLSNDDQHFLDGLLIFAPESGKTLQVLMNPCTYSFGVRRALVIDDSLVIRKSVGRTLARLGFEVDLAVNGQEGLKWLQQNVFNVVICDYLMPVMDGLDCVQQYREWEKDNRPSWTRQYIVGISSHASITDVEDGKTAGMNDFKSKPVTMKHLKDLENR